jgi:hypothetical protein
MLIASSSESGWGIAIMRRKAVTCQPLLDLSEHMKVNEKTTVSGGVRSSIHHGQAQIARAINRLGGMQKAADRLGVSRQVLWKWLQEGNLPLLRAMQVSRLARIPWRDLSPRGAKELDLVTANDQP